MVSTSTIKKFIYLLDIICILLAAILIGFGAYILCTNDTNESGEMGGYAYIIMGVATFVVFIFLHCGAIRDNVCCTVTFIVLIILLILAQTGIMVLLTVGRDTVASNLANTVDVAWEEELKSPGAMSIYETTFACCGRASPQDYIVNDRFPPKTCFIDENATLPQNLIDTGCRIKFDDYWMKLLLIFNIIAYVLIALEFVLSIISCWMCNSIRNDHRRSYY